MAKEKVMIIDVTPKWENLVSMFLHWTIHGSESQRQYAKEEIERLAKIADTFMVHREHGGLTCKCGETFDLS